MTESREDCLLYLVLRSLVVVVVHTCMTLFSIVRVGSANTHDALLHYYVLFKGTRGGIPA